MMNAEKEQKSTELIFWSWGHDIDNKSATIQSLVSVIKHYLSQQSPDLNLVDARLDMIAKISSEMAKTPLPFILEKVSVNSQILKLIERLRLLPRYENITFRIDLDGNPHVLANSVWLTRVFEELFENAIDAMDEPDKEIEIFSRISKGRAAISVKDRGMGIDFKYLSNILEDPPILKADGKGRGLYIAKLTIELYGGHIEMDASSEGTTITITLPTSDNVGQE